VINPFLEKVTYLKTDYNVSMVITNTFNFYCGKYINTDPNACNSRGKCIIEEVCSCQYGYSGKYCETTLCFGKTSYNTDVCSRNGYCIKPDICLCNYGKFKNNPRKDRFKL
jgi:hypothetical protein